MSLSISIKGYEGHYCIDKNGEIINVKHGSSLKVNYSTPYPSIQLTKDGLKKSFNVHRLLALYFIPNPENKKTVNHKNGNKRDFSLSNLEWSTQSENCKHAYSTGLAKVSDVNKKRVSETHSGANHYNSKKIINKITGEIYDTIRAAAAANGLKVQTLHRHLHKNNPSFFLSFHK